MICLTLHDLILPIGLAGLAVVTQAAPVHPPSRRALDPCGILGITVAPDISYDMVSACYNSIPYNQSAASTTLDSVSALFNDFYTFRDSAMNPEVGSPFDREPTDIIKGFEDLKSGGSDSDFQFHMDLKTVISRLYDAHSAYHVACYQAYSFTQPMSLYAPVVDGRQEIRVFEDRGSRGYEDCIVRTIDGQDAFTYLKGWADKNVYYSKDPGVRMNHALATQTCIAETGGFDTVPGEFAQRGRLPEKATVEYTLQCNNSDSYIQANDQWDVSPVFKRSFTDVSSYVSNLCLPPPPRAATRSKSLGIMSKYYSDIMREEDQLSEAATSATTSPSVMAPSAPQPETATWIGGQKTAVYQLKEYPHVGVVVVPTHQIAEGELNSLYQNLAKLYFNGVTDIIIDMQGNEGGYISFASSIVQMFFPNEGILDTALLSNLRVTESIEQVARAGYNQSWAKLYSSTDFWDYYDNKFYSNDELFTMPVTWPRFGRTANYSEITCLSPFNLNPPTSLLDFPWTNNASHIRLLTDGRCGSACSQSEFYFTKYKNVSSYAVGGFPDWPLSKSSFPGGALGELSELTTIYDKANVTGPLKPLPYYSYAYFTMIETFAPGDYTVPLDYDAKQFPADYRMPFTPKNARNRDDMWNQVAAHAWGPK
ncbi:hypothetical protein BGX29_010915 [Mortierella sp. GBA35]|nr:hypothetical protein BGX29_010915 [Mortierella sp. GBA35]